MIIPSESVSGQNMPNVPTYMYTGDNEGASSSCVYTASSEDLQQQITNNDVNRLVDKMNDCFLNCGEKTFGNLENEYGNTSKNPSCYGPECKNKRRKWHRAKHR